MTCLTQAMRQSHWRSCRKAPTSHHISPHRPCRSPFLLPPSSRVNIMEDEDGNIHLRGLSMHPASDEEEALNLLFLVSSHHAHRQSHTHTHSTAHT